MRLKKLDIVISFLSACDCLRTLKIDPDIMKLSAINLHQTYCSESAYIRGSHQKIVAFTFYGNISNEKHKKRQYFEGIEANLKSMKDFYPSWNMRLYINLTEHNLLMEHLCKISCENDIIDICDISDFPKSNFEVEKVPPSMWRFLPVLDPQVILSLDLRNIHVVM